jgi:hypothetical protein
MKVPQTRPNTGIAEWQIMKDGATSERPLRLRSCLVRVWCGGGYFENATCRGLKVS